MGKNVQLPFRTSAQLSQKSLQPPPQMMDLDSMHGCQFCVTRLDWRSLIACKLARQLRSWRLQWNVFNFDLSITRIA